jgi:hypothetical protein
MAAALSEGNEISFISYLDKSTPDYQDISNNVGALLAQDEVAASLDVLSESGDDEKLEALVDWFVQITSRDGFNRVKKRSKGSGRSRAWILTRFWIRLRFRSRDNG